MVAQRVRERYLRDPVPVRLGGLAADLARIASFAENPKNRAAVASLFEEGKHFAEWAAPDAPIETQAILADVQVWLALWQRRWLAGRRDREMRDEAKQWSDRLLELSGLAAER
jgi:hypothetical protein